MARRRGRGARVLGGDRSSIGDNHVHDGCTKLDKMCRQAVAAMVTFEPSHYNVLRWMVSPETWEKLQAAKPLLEIDSIFDTYTIAAGANLRIDFRVDPGAGWQPKYEFVMPVFNDAAMELQPPFKELLDAVAQIRTIYEEFEVAKYVLRWFNSNATPGAIRYYWPTALTLCPHSPALQAMQETPTRFSEPEGISERLPLIRESAGTVAKYMFVRDQAEKPDRYMVVTLSSDGIQRDNTLVVPASGQSFKI